MSTKQNIAFFMLHLSDLSGGGGAERFFADFFQIYNDQSDSKYNLFFLIDDATQLHKINKLNTHIQKLIKVPEKRFSFNKKLTDLLLLTPLMKRLRIKQTQLKFISLLVKHKIKLVHIPLYTDSMYDFFSCLKYLPPSVRPKLVLNIVDCRIPYTYFNPGLTSNKAATHLNFDRLLKNVKIDGVFSWYENFCSFALQHKLFKQPPVLRAIKSRFTLAQCEYNFDRKKNLIVFAHRLDEQKNPLFFLEGIREVITQKPELIKDWEIRIYGKGPLENEVNSFISNNKLNAYISSGYEARLQPVFEKSKCFISTQDFENFPSLSMAEAMSCGNAVIARSVGQTNYYVKHNLNGYVLQQDSPSGLAQSLITYLNNSDRHESMCRESVKLMREVHNVESFVTEIEGFWEDVLSRNEKR